MSLSIILKKLFIITLFLFISLITFSNAQEDTSNNNAILINDPETTNSSGDSPFYSNKLHGDIGAQAATFAFLILAMVDYLIYTLLFLYVFCFVVLNSRGGKIILGTLIILLFIGIRLVFIPLILNAIPYDWAPKFPELLIEISFYACTISYIVFFNLPVIASLYFVIKFGFSGKKLKGGIINPETKEIPNVVIMMPIYNEDELPLFRAVESAIRSDYPPEKLHLLLAFDDASESSLYWSLLKKLKVLNKNVQMEWEQEFEKINTAEQDKDSLFLFPPRLELTVEGVRVTICRFPHEGKSATQGKGFKIINEMYGTSQRSIDNTLLMYIDSDVILHDNALYNFVSTMVNHPKMNACTGYITCRTSDKPNLLHYLQDAEYLEGQMFARSLEALAGSVTCLPGALTMLRLQAMRSVSDQYFIDFDKRKPLNFHRYYLGEDRYMTHLLMENSQHAHTIGLCGASRCKTDAPDTWQKLVKQRRRWYLGALINEAHMLCTPRLWKVMPILLLLKLFDYASGSLSWLFMVYIVGVIKGVVPIWTMCVFFPCLVLKYLLLSINASFMNRTKIFISFPIFFIINPIFKMWCTIYSIFTWDTRSWGGPRTDAKEEIDHKQKMQELMKRRQQSIKRSKKLLKQMKQRYKILNHNLLSESTKVENSAYLNEKAENGAMPLKKILPFPYEVEILGGGEYFTDLIYPGVLASHKRNLSNIDSEVSSISEGDINIVIQNEETNSPINRIDEKYIYGKYHKHNPSFSNSSLDLNSLSRMEKLTSTKHTTILDPNSFASRLSVYSSAPTSANSSVRHLSVNNHSSVAIESNVNTLPTGMSRSPLSQNTEGSPHSTQFGSEPEISSDDLDRN